MYVCTALPLTYWKRSSRFSGRWSSIIHCFKKPDPKTGWYNFIKLGPFWIIFSEDASAFNCELTAFEKLNIGWVPTVWFPWQQHHHAGARIQEANMRPELKPLVVKVWGWLPTNHRWQDPYQWRKRLHACVQTKGQHFEQLLYFVATLPCEMSAFHWSRHWSVASPAWVRRPAARRTHWTFDVKTAGCDSYFRQ